MTGAGVPGDTPRDSRRRIFTESVEMIRENAGDPRRQFFLGATVNPYQYTPYTLMGQYFKLVKKLNAGASFIVTQAGWDMLKLQSLRWYLSGRSLYYPMIARLLLLTPDRVEQILRGEYPGINISPDFRKILDKELHYSLNQFEAAQYRRLELAAAGCRLLGFSGIQLAGAEVPGPGQNRRGTDRQRTARIHQLRTLAGGVQLLPRPGGDGPFFKQLFPLRPDAAPPLPGRRPGGRQRNRRTGDPRMREIRF